MGMDVHGRPPTNPEGENFHNKVWGWHPLATYCCEAGPEITLGCEYWHSNDGDGLDAKASVALADKLQAEIDAGRTAKWADKYDEGAPAAVYPFSVDNVQNFVKFLRASGGFT